MGVGLGLIGPSSAVAQAAAGASAQLEAGFRQPPPAARPSAYYLMLNGYLNRDYVEREIEALAAMGVGGLCIFDMGGRGAEATLPPAGPVFMSDAWLDQLAVVLRKAKQLGLTAQLCVSSSWDMGASWVEPRDASMALYHVAREVVGPAEVDLLLPLPELPAAVPRDDRGQPRFIQEVALLALPNAVAQPGGASPSIRDRGEILDLSAHLDEQGQLRWEAPAGRWTVLRFVCANTGERLKVPSPQSDGLATDHFSASVTRAYIRSLTDRLHARLGDLRQTALRQLYLPSYEVVGNLWTPDLLERFREYRGYDMTRFLPALIGYVIEDRAMTDDFLYDFRETMGDLLVDAYYRTASETTHEIGLGIEAEAGGPGPPVHQVPVDALRALGSIDEVRGEFWPWRLTNDPLWVVKETACAAHVYGRRRVHMEAFTGFHHWTAGPFDLKFSADRAFGEGMNHVVWHTSSHQPPEAGRPGWVYGAGTHLTPNLIWWPYAKPFLDYLARCSYLLQQGLFVADVCYYYGDQGYNFIPPKHVDPSLGYGYDYDVANPEVILTRMRVVDGRITLPDGMQYELLVLPEREDMDPVVLEKVADLVRAGATVVGPKPVRANGLTDRKARDRRIRELAEAVWGACDGTSVRENRYGLGRIVWGRSLRAVLRERGVNPDFQFTSDRTDTALDFVHRRTPDADIYFVRNTRLRWETVDLHFRVRNKTPEIWDPVSGEITVQPVFESRSEGTRVPLKLAPGEVVFVVFRQAASEAHLTQANPELETRIVTPGTVAVTAYENGSYPFIFSTGGSVAMVFDQIPPPVALPGPWQVHFPVSFDLPPEVRFDSLRSWTEHESDAIRFFSGIARYETTFAIPPNWGERVTRVELDLGKLWAVGEVILNGQTLGIQWDPPFRIEITDALVPGTNRVEIEVANTWSNRLIGDAQLPEDRRRTRTNITRSGGKAWKDVPLHESGLLGPVTLRPAMTKTLPLSASP